VPPEEFVDDAMMERIENAENKTSKKPNKAARNIPKKEDVKPIPKSAKPKAGFNTKKTGQ